MKNYFIQKNYKCNLDSHGNAIQFLDDEHVSKTYQIKVYEYAKKLICKYGGKSILDIGCGFGVKLKEIILPVCDNIVGIDTRHAIDFCRKEHSFGRWIEDKIEKPVLALNEKFDLIISSDVIEHLVDPDNLLNYIKKYSHGKTHIIISTPERDLIGDKNSTGPPLNKNHVREWNRNELYKYIRNSSFKVNKHFLVGERGQSLYEVVRKIILLKPFKKIQVIHCTVKM